MSLSLSTLVVGSLIAGLAAAGPQQQPRRSDPVSTTVFKIQGPGDMTLQGAEIGDYGGGGICLRSGSCTAGKNTTSTAALNLALTPGVAVDSLGFVYRYQTGYKGPVGMSFVVKVGGAVAYASPMISDYPYTKAGNYSPPVTVAKTGLGLKVSKGDQIVFEFINVDKNIEILLPFEVTIGCTGGSCTAAPKLLAQFFDSHMVLARSGAQIWGDAAAPGDAVTVTVAGAGVPFVGKATASSTGSWAVSLGPQPAATGAIVTVRTASGGKQTLTDVAFGDVYLCSGQSNMEFSVNLAFNASAEIADSARYPGLRFFTGAEVGAAAPATKLPDAQSKFANQTMIGPYAESSWAVSGPAAFVPAGGPTFTWPSAACYFFGRDVYAGLGGKVPIGLVASDWGGEPIQPFMSADALADKTCGGTNPGAAAAAAAAVPAPVATPRVKVGDGDGSGTIWNGMIAPLAKMRFAGVVWYQGESNAPDGHDYNCLFPAMIADWRKKFEAPAMPFYWVVLAPCYGHHECRPFVTTRAAQLPGSAAMTLPSTAYAVAVDLGDPDSPASSVHSRRKQEVGRRLALQALRMHYNETVTSTGPVFKSSTVSGTTVTVAYAPGTADGLHTGATGACNETGSKLCCNGGVSPFSVETAKGGWAPAKFTISGSTAVLEAPAGATPTGGVQFGWQQAPECMLYNGAGGADDHAGIVGTPFCWNGTALCPV